jgi:hypothetical protein
MEERLRVWQRLWITPGAALVTARVESPDGSVLQDAALTPHLGVAWDATGDQRTWLRASVHRRVGTHFEEAAALTPGMAARQTCRWDQASSDFSRDCVVTGGPEGRTVGLPCGASNAAPDGSPCAVAPRLPGTWEVTVGGGREIIRNLTLDLDLVHRRASGLPGVRETNRLWNAAGESTVGFRTGRPQPIDDWSTSGSLGRRYLGLTASLEKRAGRFRALAAYSWSRRSVDIVPTGDYTAAGWTDLEGQGDFHGVRFLAAADILGYASLGFIYAYDRGGLQLVSAATGRPPGFNPNDPGDDPPWVAPESQRLNLQVRARARRLLPVDVDLYFDVINVLDWGATSVRPDSPDFLPAPRVQEPRWFRLGAEWRY